MAAAPVVHKVEPAAGCFLVTSGRSGKLYRVVPTGGDTADCHCEWSRHGRGPCSHVKAVREFARKALGK